MFGPQDQKKSHRFFGRKFSYIRSPENELLGAMQTLEKYRPLQSTRSTLVLLDPAD
jgi:hypothetical protein